MSLLLEIEFLTGVCRAARGPADPAPDWPPQPDRIFSALVASWGVRGEDPAERAALEWLERQSPPSVHASEAEARCAPRVFVPPNDARASKTERRYLEVLPEKRPRQPRRFPVARPEQAGMFLVWPDEPSLDVLASLDAVARDVAAVGHSASLVRCRFRTGEAPTAGTRARRRIYPGRLAELERAFRADPLRPDIAPGASVPAPIAEPATGGSDWLVLEIVGGEAPDIRASPILCRTLRRAVMAGYDTIGRGDAVPALVSGHDADGAPTREDHIAVVPMSFAGFAHADGRPMGFALVPPRGVALADVPFLAEAFAAVAPFEAARERRVLELFPAPGAQSLALAPVRADAPASLSPEPYLRPASIWGTVTPMVLDRHLKGRGESEIRELVADACARRGLPRPDPDRIQVGRHAAVEGAASARPPAGAPPWLRWRLPEALSTRSLVHVVIDFGEPVEGPVLLGAGRYVGLGLMRGLGR